MRRRCEPRRRRLWPRSLLQGVIVLNFHFLNFHFLPNAHQVKDLTLVNYRTFCRAKAEQLREEMAAKFAEMEERMKAREGELEEAQDNIR